MLRGGRKAPSMRGGLADLWRVTRNPTERLAGLTSNEPVVFNRSMLGPRVCPLDSERPVKLREDAKLAWLMKLMDRLPLAPLIAAASPPS